MTKNPLLRFTLDEEALKLTLQTGTLSSNLALLTLLDLVLDGLYDVEKRASARHKGESKVYESIVLLRSKDELSRAEEALSAVHRAIA